MEMKNQLLAFLLFFMGCTVGMAHSSQDNQVLNGDAQTSVYLPMLQNKRIALFSNHTGMVNGQHILDHLLACHMKVTCILSPEHGFRGNADAGEQVGNSVDPQTGIPIRSLYASGDSTSFGAYLKKNADILVIDIQDVGLRFYTYYISMYQLMDQCAQLNLPVLILDRANPNGFYVDGPILDMKYKSGVGILPIPVVYGMTLGELARMINGEGWLTDKRVCPLTVVPCKNYTHRTKYRITVAPSPNLPNMKAVYLYPSICYFEGTVVSLGRGTDFPFQVYGHPNMKGCTFTFTPRSKVGARNPPLLNRKCYGVDLRDVSDQEIWRKGLDLSYVIDAYHKLGVGDQFFTSFFEKLIGVDYVRKMIEEGKTAAEIKACWKADVVKFKLQRAPYLLYRDE
jgi:uncharacterized protein YbbC (DUF1343 family)